MRLYLKRRKLEHVEPDIAGDCDVWLDRGVEVIYVIGSEVWIRTTMPEDRRPQLKASDPDFFKKFNKALKQARKVVTESYQTKRALAGLRDYMLGGSR